jgi:broad-specificity NMP kinase/uncharacterized protein (UPF0335 family)
MGKTAEDKQAKSASEVLDRAEREVRRLSEMGVDVAALTDRFESAKSAFAAGKHAEAEMTCSEILVLAKSMGAIASASLKAVGKGEKKITESMRMEISRLVSKEVSERVEAVARTLPTASNIEESVQAKIQEALVTGGLIERLEAVATQKAQAAVSSLPRFTAKDAQAAANLVVQRSLTQFLSSKELAGRIKAAVADQVGKALEETEKKINKATEALVSTAIASATSPLPTKEAVGEEVQAALARFLKDSAFEDRVLELAAERAKAEVERAPDLMSETAGKLAREAADSLLKTHMRSAEFSELVKTQAREVVSQALETGPGLSQEDVEVIARRVADESLGSLADSDILREKITSVAGEVAESALGPKLAEVVAKAEQVAQAAASAEDVEAKVKEAIVESRRELMTSEDFGEWIKDGARAALEEAGLGGGIEDLQKKLVTPDKIEKIARHEALTAAMDVLETKEFTRRIAAVLDEKAVRAKVEEISGGAEDLEEKLSLQVQNAFAEGLESGEFAEKVEELAGGSGAQKALIERVERMEKEALPALIEKAVSEKLGAASEEGISAKIDEALGAALSTKLDAAAIQQQVMQMVGASIKDISNSPEFKAMLDGKFKVMMNYISQDVIPKQIKRIMGG